MSGASLLVVILVGLIAGWLAGHLVRGTGYGLVADLCLGIIGAFIGDWLLPRLGIHVGYGIVSAIISATIGAVILLIILRLFRRGGRWKADCRQADRHGADRSNPLRWPGGCCPVRQEPILGALSIS